MLSHRSARSNLSPQVRASQLQRLFVTAGNRRRPLTRGLKMDRLMGKTRRSGTVGSLGGAIVLTECLAAGRGAASRSGLPQIGSQVGPALTRGFLALVAVIGAALLTVRAVAAQGQPDREPQIVVGTAADYPPYSYRDENGERAGFNPALTRALAKTMGMNVRIRIGQWPDIRKALETGEIDAISGMYYSKERDKLVDFSPPYTIVYHAIFALRSGPKVTSLEQLRGRKIIVVRGDIMHDYVIENGLSDSPALVDNLTDALRLLASGQHDCVLTAKLPGLYWAKKLKLPNIVVVGPPFHPAKYCYAVKEGNAALLARFTEGLAMLQQTGQYHRIYEESLGAFEPERISARAVLKYVALVAAPLLLILAAAVVWTWTLRRQVARRTRELREEIVTRERAEETQRESEARYEELIENMPSGVAVYRAVDNGEDFVLASYNRGGETMDGVSRQDVIGKRVTEAFPGVKELGLFEVFQRVWRTGETEHLAAAVYRDETHPGRWRENWVYRLPSGEIVAVFKDVTERMRAEAALRESEQRLRHLNAVLRGVRNVNQLITHEEDPVRLAQGACDNLVVTLGYHNAWMARQDKDGHMTVTAHAGLDEGFAPMAERLARDKLPACARRALAQSGVVITRDPRAECADCPLSHAYAGRTDLTVRIEHAGEVYGVMCVSAPSPFADDAEGQKLFEEVAGDIALGLHNIKLAETRGQAEEALRESEERFRAVVENAPFGYYRVGRDGLWQYVNPVWERMHGYTLQEIEGKPFEVTQPEDCVEQAREHVRRVLSGETKTGESGRRRRDGSIEYHSFNIQPVHEHGEIVAIEGFISDITARKRAEEQRRESEERYRALVEGSPYAICELDASGVIVFANRAHHDMYGCEEGELVGRSITDFLVSGSQRDDLSGDLAMVVKDQPAPTLYYQVIRRGDGTERDVEVAWDYLRDAQGRVTGLIAVITDITERKQAEEALRRTEEFLRQSEKMEAIGQLAGGVAHDFNNQLSGIMGYADMLARELADERLRGFAEAIVRAATRSAGLTEQLLAFARKGKFLSAPVNLHELIGEVVALLERSIDKRITIQQILKANPPVTLGDPNQLQNALLNIAINARDAMPGGGEIIFETEALTLDEEYCRSRPFPMTPGLYVRVSVTDNGVGMDHETQQRIFEPFFTTKPTGEGTGMGLAAAYGVVKNHHGIITVYSEPGQGTTINVFLPVVESAEPYAGRTGAGAIVTGTGRILLVDDEEAVRGAASTMLRHLGYKVTVCKDGVEAVDYYRRSWQSVDLVILDMAMPRMGGGDTFLAMREINPDIKALLSSGYGINGEAQSILDLGVMGFLKKPFQLAHLSEMVAEALAR